MKREITYHWRIRELMARQRIRSSTELVEPLRERGITLSASQVYRLVAQDPERIAFKVLVAWPHLAKVGGAIVNIGSVAGVQGARALPQAAHAAAKGAVIGLTRQLAAEGVAVGVRVNCVSPGVMATPPVLAMFEKFGENAPVAPILERTIDGKPGDPLAVAYAGLYLASDEAKWVTGSHLVVDGGAHAVM